MLKVISYFVIGKQNYYTTRRTSNCDEVVDESAEDNPGVTAIESVDEEDGCVSHDKQIAQGLALEEHLSNATPPLVSTKVVNPSTPSTSTATASSKIKLNMYLQDKTQNFHATAASCRRKQVTNEMLNLIKDINKHANEEDDELGLSFTSMTKRKRKNLNEKRHENILISIQKLVSNAIENAKVGIPMVPPPPNLLQDIPSCTPTTPISI